MTLPFPEFRIVPIEGVATPQRYVFVVGTRIVLQQPDEPVKSIDCGLHQALHLFLGDVRELGLAAANRTRFAIMQILDRSIAKSQSNESFRFIGEIGSKVIFIGRSECAYELLAQISHS